MNGELDSTKVTALKHQVHTLRHDLAEKNALLATVQKKLSRSRPQYYNSGTTNESTTGKVIGHLQHEIEHLKKEVADAKTQIHIAKVARERADRQVSEHSASHQTLKLEIDSLKRMLEQRENNNKLLEESERKAAELEKQVAAALGGKELAEIQYQLLSKELQNFKTRYSNDVESIKKEYQVLRNELNSTSKELKTVVTEASSRVETLTKDRKAEVANLEAIQKQLRENQENSIASLLDEVEKMKKDVESSNQKTQLYSEQVAKVDDEIANKMKWLKNIKTR
ncbi:10154_t:CDS:2 [Rhizophagus irregularis]|nr:10154_t:CDS:2 [Rhizophagus irregularis]